MALIPNSVATCRSARLAAFASTSDMRARCAGRPGFSNRSGSAPARSAGTTSRPEAPGGAGVWPLMTWCSSSLVRDCSRRASGRLRAEPHRAPDQGGEPDDPGDEALVDGADEAEAEAAGRRLLLRRLEVGDDVPAPPRGDRLVVEHRHRLRAGELGLEDVGRGGAVQVQRVLAAGQGAAPAAVAVVALDLG